MKSDLKEALAHTAKMDAAACAIRIKAARVAAGLTQVQLAEALGLNRTTNISNMEKALSLPNREVMSYFWREHRIDFNFLIYGLYSGLASDVQDRLFPALEVANNEWDQRESSGRSATLRQPPQSQT